MGRSGPDRAVAVLIDRDSLAALMQDRGLTQAELARQVSRSKGTISHLVTGRMVQCSPDLAVSISAQLGVDVAVLFAARWTTDTGGLRHPQRSAA
jgi:transcriptional regulator with XRE-family HTH domain